MLFQTIQYIVQMTNSSIWPLDRTLSNFTTLGQSGSGSNGNEGVLCFPQSSSIIGVSPSDCLVSYPGHLWVGCLTPLELVYDMEIWSTRLNKTGFLPSCNSVHTTVWMHHMDAIKMQRKSLMETMCSIAMIQLYKYTNAGESRNTDDFL